MYKNFIDDCLAGDALINEIDDYIDYWHENDIDKTLQEFLGLTDYEYNQWLKNDNSILRDILRCRADGIDFKDYNFMSKEEKIAARSSDIEAIEKLKNDNQDE